jgi:hypothetical protein
VSIEVLNSGSALTVISIRSHQLMWPTVKMIDADGVAVLDIRKHLAVI